MTKQKIRAFFAQKINFPPRKILDVFVAVLILILIGTFLPVKYNGTWASPLQQIIQKEKEKEVAKEAEAKKAAQEAAKKEAEQQAQNNSSNSSSSSNSNPSNCSANSVAFYADSQSDSDEEDALHQSTVDAIISSGANPVFHAGDFLEDGTDDSWNRFNNVTSTLRSIRSFYAALGNNDRVDGDSSTANPHYANDLGLSDHYAVTAGNLRLIVLDSAFSSAGAQTGFLTTELQNNQDKIVVSQL